RHTRLQGDWSSDVCSSDLATALARTHEDDAPHLIYLPERRVSLDQIAADVERVYRRLGRVVIAVCEGQLDEKGTPFGADVDRARSEERRVGREGRCCWQTN